MTGPSSDSDTPAQAHAQPPRKIARRCLVAGRVQGVYYRGSARARASAAGIAGHALNLPDGRVEVLAFGDEGAVLEFIEWLWVGSAAAQVTQITVEELELAAHERPQDFRTA